MPDKPKNRIEPLWPPSAASSHQGLSVHAQELMAKLNPLAKQLETLMGQHPRATLTVAGTLGVLLGWIVKRK